MTHGVAGHDVEAEGARTELGAETQDGLPPGKTALSFKTKVQVVLVNLMELLLRFWVFTEKTVASNVVPGSQGAKAIGFLMNPQGFLPMGG